MATSNFINYSDLPMLVWQDENEIDFIDLESDIREVNRVFKRLSDKYDNCNTLSDIELRLINGYYGGFQLTITRYDLFEQLDDKTREFVRQMFTITGKRNNALELYVYARFNNGKAIYKTRGGE